MRRSMSTMKSCVSSFHKKEDGGIALFAALTLPVVIGFAGLGLETALWYKNDASAQTAADIAAHAAAMELKTAGMDEDLADQVAINAAMQLGFNPGDVTTNVEETDSGIEVDVTIETTARRYFSAALGETGDVSLTAESSALVESAGEACLLALDPGGEGVVFSGTTGVKLNECLVMSNAESNDALSVTGSATLGAACAAAVGNVDIQKDEAVDFSDCKKARPFAAPTIDPYAGLPMPDLTEAPYDTCASMPGGGKGKGKKSGGLLSQIESGRYCGGFEFSDLMHFKDGATIVVDGGTFENKGQAALWGEDVTIIFMNDAKMKLTSQAEMNLKAKTSGTYAGLIFAGHAGSQSTSHRFNGGSLTRLQGAFYLPTDTLELRGGANMQTGCLHMIAKDIDARGNSRFSNDCDSAGTKPLVVTGGIRMVD